MTRLLHLLLLFGILAGLGGRVLAGPLASFRACEQSVECCDGHQPDEQPAGDEHQPDCPPGPHDHEHPSHHHHGPCCVGVWVATDEAPVCRLARPAGSRLALWRASEPVPDGPVLGMDKPPLI